MSNTSLLGLFATTTGVNIENLLPPVGSIVAYNPGYYTSNVNGGFTLVGPATNDVAGVNAFLPVNWVVCDGSLAYNVDSPIWNMAVSNNRRVPNLTTSRFLMGSTSAGTAADQDTATGTASVSWTSTTQATTFTQPSMPAHYHSADSSGSTINITSSGSHSHGYNQSATGAVANGTSGASANVTVGGGGYALVTIASASHTHPTANLTGLVGFVTGGQNGDTATATTGGAASFNKNVMNTNQTAHSHTVDVTPNYLSTFYIIRIF